MSTRCGGTSSAREATAEVQELCDKVSDNKLIYLTVRASKKWIEISWIIVIFKSRFLIQSTKPLFYRLTDLKPIDMARL